MRANALTDAELRRKAADELSCMTARINRGEAIPEPVKQLPVMGGRPLNRAQALAKIAEIKATERIKCMTGKEAIIHYLGTHKSFCAQDVAAVTGATVTSINQAAAKMARAGILVVDGKVWRTVYYRFATREEREGKVSTNLIFKECRQSAAMKRVLRVYKRTSMGTQ